MSSRNGVPPAWLRRALAALLPREDRVTQLNEMDVLYERHTSRYGRMSADVWYALQVPSFAARLIAYRVSKWHVQGRARRSAGRPFVRTAHQAERAWWSLRGALRSLSRGPLYAVASIATLGIGVAALSSVHAVANYTLLRPVPGVTAPDELVTVLLGSVESVGSWPISNPDFEVIADRARSLSRITAVIEQDVHVSVGNGAPDRTWAAAVARGYFDVLGVRMSAGRPFTPAEATGRVSPHVLVLSEAFARRHWSGAAQAIGAELRINGLPYTVVGVTSAGFRGESLPGRTQLWLPGGALPDVLHDPQIMTLGGRQVWETLIGRPAAGASLAVVESEMNGLMEAIRQEKAGQMHSFLATHFTFRVYRGIGLPPSLRASTARTLWILGGSAALLLLLACANVANLGIARAATMSAAVALRRALGAGSATIIAERLTESVLLGLTGGVLGVGLGAATIATLRATGLGLLGVPLNDVSLDYRVVAFTLLAGMLAGILAGVLPAAVSNRDRAASLLRAGRNADRGSSRAARALVVVQVALSAVLLVGAALLSRTLTNLGRVDLGVDDTGVLTFAIDPGLQGYDQGSTTRFVRDLSTRLASEDGVRAVAAAWSPPFESLYVPYVLKRPDAGEAGASEVLRSFMVTPAFFRTIGIELVAGRTFREDESWAESEPVAILNETAARAIYPDLPPAAVVGRIVQRRGAEDALRVVAVVRDARLERPGSPPRPYVFVPWAQGFDVGRFTMYVQTDRTSDVAAPMIRAHVTGLDPALPLFGLRTWHSEIRSLLSEQRLVASLASGLAGFGLLLAAIGLYGLLALAVTRRTREIGIRVALGARPGHTLMGIVRTGIFLSLVGLAPGLLAGAWLSRVLESRLYGIGHLDAGTYAVGATILFIVAVAASVMPARRAMRIEPMQALRGD